MLFSSFLGGSARAAEIAAFAAAFIILFVFAALAAPVNPDISVIGDTRATWSEAEEDVDLEFHELEVAFVGALNPYATGEVFLGIHGTEGIEIEEAKLLLNRYFPGGFGLTAGRYLIDFGQLNTIHSHAYPFIDRPLMHEEFFGEDGVVDIGARLDWISPTEGMTVRASAAAVRGDLFIGGHHHEEEVVEEEHESVEPEIGYTGRLDLFAEPSSNTSFLIGGSILTGIPDPDEDDARALWFGPDMKFRWDTGPASALVLNAEAVFGSLDETLEEPSADPFGWFASADYRANKRWNFGGMAESSTEPRNDEIETMRYGAFLGMALMEETTLFRLVGRITEPEEGDSETDAILQAIFGMGPHKAHRY